MKRIFMHVPDQAGQGYYRAKLPTLHLNAIGIDIEASDTLASLDYDAFVFHRLVRADFLPVLEKIKSLGKKLIWELDDDCWHIPSHNPASRAYDQAALDILDWTRDAADRIIVSTEPLAKVIDFPSKTTILPNLLDLNDWPQEERKPKDKLHVVWAGSVHHTEDLEEIAPAIERLAVEYHDKVQFLFFGDMPDSMAEYVRIKYSHLGMMVPHARFKGSVGLVRPVPTGDYPLTLQSLQPDIALAPLTDEIFNSSKSNLKYLEYSMAGAATIASNTPPYEDAVALQIEPGDTHGWYELIKHLIDHVGTRRGLRKHAYQDVLENWTWQKSPHRQLWINFFKEIS